MTTELTPSRNPMDCWAAPIGGCGTKRTGEHIISKSQFGDAKMVTVRGLPWCAQEPKQIGINSLVANHLCDVHNHALSPVDAAARQVLDAIAFAYERAESAKREPKQFPKRVFRVAGDELERWLLKTTINVALVENRQRPRGGIFDDSGRPATRFVEIAFGRAAFEPAEGLYWVAAVGESMSSDQVGTIDFQAWRRKEDTALVSAFVRFHGHRLWLATHGAPRVKFAMHPMRAIDVADVGVRLELNWSRARERQFRAFQSPGPTD